MELGDNPMKIYKELESVFGTASCWYDAVCRWIWRFQSGKKSVDEPRSGAPKTVMNENVIELVRCSSWPTYLNSGHNWNLLPFTWYNSPNYPWRTRYKKGVCKVGTWLPDRGHKQWREWDVLNRCLPCFEPQRPKRMTDVTGDETFISFYKGMDQWNRGQTNHSQTWILE